MNNQSNTHQGTNVEHLFANSILDHPNAWNSILTSIGYGAAIGMTPTIEVIGTNRRKTDVVIDFGNNSKLAPVRVTIKSFTKGGFNQIGRQKLSGFCERNLISSSDQEFLKELILRKAKNSKDGNLVEQNEQARVRKIFTGIEPGITSLLGSDHPQILALYSVDLGRWHLYNISRQVEPLIRSQGITFGSRNSNIDIGDYVAIQRKAGDKRNNMSLDNIDHPANNVQIKMRVKKFFNNVVPVSWYQL